MSEAYATASKAMGGGQHHRHATVLFSDLTGYTTLVAGLRDRLAVVARITNLLEQVAQRVLTKHRGIVNEVRGDGVVGVFGLPSNDEFDVRDAIEAALELHSTMRALTATASPADGGALDMHSGIHSGLVYVDRGTDEDLRGIAGAHAHRREGGTCCAHGGSRSGGGGCNGLQRGATPQKTRRRK